MWFSVKIFFLKWFGSIPCDHRGKSSEDLFSSSEPAVHWADQACSCVYFGSAPQLASEDMD